MRTATFPCPKKEYRNLHWQDRIGMVEPARPVSLSGGAPIWQGEGLELQALEVILAFLSLVFACR